jgi:hypothetical protein
MQSPLQPKPMDDPHDTVVIPPDAVRVAPSDDEISDLLREAARQHSGAQARTEPDHMAESELPPLDASFRPTAVNDHLAPRRGRIARAIATLILAGCVGAAAMAWQGSGYAAKKLVAKWLPQFALTTSLPWDKVGLGAESAPAADESAAADATPPATAAQAVTQTAAAPAAPESAASNTTGQPSDPGPSLPSMARDLASVSQQVEALKASIAELKASQQQMARELAKASEKASEQNTHAKSSSPPARATTASTRKPAPPYLPSSATTASTNRPSPPNSPAQAGAPPAVPQTVQPFAPRQVEPLPSQAEPVPRPPLPVQ